VSARPPRHDRRGRSLLFRDRSYISGIGSRFAVDPENVWPEPFSDRVVVLAARELFENRLVLSFHQFLDGGFDVVFDQQFGIFLLLGGDDVSTVEEMGDDVGIRTTTVLGLDVE